MNIQQSQLRRKDYLACRSWCVVVIKNVDNVDVCCSIVNEAGASIYSASDDAKKELPDLDISIRGAGTFVVSSLLIIASLAKGGYVFGSVCLFVFLSVCK